MDKTEYMKRTTYILTRDFIVDIIERQINGYKLECISYHMQIY